MRWRFGSAESVVFPVPLRPKSSDDAPVFLSAVAEQCIESNAAFRREIIRHREDALLHLAGVFGAENNQLLVLDAEVDACGRAHAGGQLVRRERARVDR